MRGVLSSENPSDFKGSSPISTQQLHLHSQNDKNINMLNGHVRQPRIDTIKEVSIDHEISSMGTAHISNKIARMPPFSQHSQAGKRHFRTPVTMVEKQRSQALGVPQSHLIDKSKTMGGNTVQTQQKHRVTADFGMPGSSQINSQNSDTSWALDDSQQIVSLSPLPILKDSQRSPADPRVGQGDRRRSLTLTGQ